MAIYVKISKKTDDDLTMAIYFSSKNIPELEKYSLKERQEILAKAQQKLTVPEKLILNLLKLIMLIPPFLFLARQEWLTFLLTVLISLAINHFISKPLKLGFCRKYIKAC